MSERKPLIPGKTVPRTSVLHPEFRYTPSTHTDIRARFAQVREQLAQKPVAFKRKTA